MTQQTVRVAFCDVVKIFSAFLLAVFIASKSALACDCVGLSEKEAFENAEIVFVGKTQSSGDISQSPLLGEFIVEHIFTLEKVLKGSVPLDSKIALQQQTTDCLATFIPNKTVTVYGYKRKTESGIEYYSTDKCINRQYGQ